MITVIEINTRRQVVSLGEERRGEDESLKRWRKKEWGMEGGWRRVLEDAWPKLKLLAQAPSPPSFN
jgi:hypothetical protein